MAANEVELLSPSDVDSTDFVEACGHAHARLATNTLSHTLLAILTSPLNYLFSPSHEPKEGRKFEGPSAEDSEHRFVAMGLLNMPLSSFKHGPLLGLQDSLCSLTALSALKTLPGDLMLSR